MSLALSGYVAIPCCPVIFDGANYAEFVAFIRIHMRGIRLWGVLSGEVPCPPRPVAPVAPTPPPTPPALDTNASDADRAAARVAADDADAAYDQEVLDYSNALSVYRDDLAAYTQWCDDDARAATVLTSSVLPQFASEFIGLGTVFEMWTHLRQRYQPSGDAFYLSVVRQEHALQQGDSTIDEFYTQSSAIRRQLDSLRTTVCGTCPCCQTVRSDLEFQRVYGFLSRLRGEFEPRRAQLFARGRVPISEVLSELRAEETRLHGAGLLQVPSVLAARGATPPVSSRSSAPPLLPTPLGSEVRSREGRSRPRTHCDYCNRDGHPESDCFKKKCDMRNRERNSSSGTRASSSTLSTVSLTEQDIVKLKRLLAASGSSTGTTGSVTGASSVERPLSTQSGSSHEGSGWG
ncbi:uncharacterized protein [Aegilops tauschii subsp. strangulata]|nr:uncharacterized protein LOC120967621 [Aegilops tauschii subsp. strangulata]